MKLHKILQLICLLLFTVSCLSVPTPSADESLIESLKSSKLSIGNFTNLNTIDDNAVKINETSSNDQVNSLKKHIDSKLIDSKLIDEHHLQSIDVKACNVTDYRCKSSDECIDKSLLCDNFKDCPLGDDEANCDHNCDEHNKFQCKSDGKCIDLILKCNSFNDCDDGSDEEDCDNLALLNECSKDEFECSSGGCIHKNKVCDHSNDCSDGSDELFCKYTCSHNEFQCKKDGKCVPLSMKCNGQNECSDGSDEEDCLQNDSNYTCAANEFSCQMEPHKCISIESVCNDIDDCGNNADEPPECKIDLCKNHHCAHSCEQTRNTMKCTCRPGFKLSANGVDCEDLNECLEIPGFCSGHECINQLGSATCNCATGYRFNENENRCKVINGKNATIIYSNQNELRNTSLSIKSYLSNVLQSSNERNNNAVFRENLNAVGSLVYDFVDNYIIWHDMNERRFYISSLDENKRPVERNEFWTKFKLPTPHHHRTPRTPLKRNQHYVLMENITNVESMALDYVHDLLYRTDTDRNVIEVAEVKNPLKRKILVDTDLDEPKGIAVDVQNSFIVFTDWGNKPKIEYIKQDGTGRRTIYDKSVEWPYSVAIDPVLEKVYWVDTKKNTLNVVNLNGDNHQVLLTNSMYLERANDLDIFEDKIFWSDQESESIISVDKFLPKATLNVLVKDLKNVLSSKIVHFSKQPIGQDRCAQSNCEFLCLPRNDIKSFTCACSDSAILDSKDGHSCVIVDRPKTTTAIETKDMYSFFDSLFDSSDSYRTNTNVIYILALGIFVILLVTVVCFYMLINYAKKKANKLKFSHAHYQKAPQQEEKPIPYLDPLNQRCTNEFV